MKTYIFKTLLLLSAVLFISCDDFLSEPPEKKSNLEIKSVEAVDMLLNHYNLVFDRSREVVLASDSYGLYKDYYLARPSLFDDQLQYILWYPELCALQSYYWEQEFQKIAYANTVLSAIDDLQGSEAEKKRIVEDAHFLRAYEFFNLTTLYCLPYSEENKSSLGMPLKQTLAYDEDVIRKSLEETMKFIEDDMKIALETTQTRDINKLFRLSLPAAQAFAARFYLYLHDYDKAEQYANVALTSHSQMVNYQTYFSPKMRNYFIGGGTYYAPNAAADYKFGETYYARNLYNHTYNAVPSEKLMNLYDKANDYRYDAFFVENYSYSRASVSGWSAYQQFGSIGILQGPTTAEMYLIRAECRARKNDTQGAVSDLNTVRSCRYKSGKYTNLTAADFPDKKSLVQFIVDERQREFPFTLRWYDIKRINSDSQNIVDKITITREFFDFNGVATDVNKTKTYTLAPGDKRFAWPIPIIDIELTKGRLVQNPYD